MFNITYRLLIAPSLVDGLEEGVGGTLVTHKQAVSPSDVPLDWNISHRCFIDIQPDLQSVSYIMC